MGATSKNKQRKFDGRSMFENVWLICSLIVYKTSNLQIAMERQMLHISLKKRKETIEWDQKQGAMLKRQKSNKWNKHSDDLEHKTFRNNWKH